MIDSYSFGKIIVDGKETSEDVIIKDSKVYGWRRKESHNVDLNDIESAVKHKPDVIVIGTGESGVMQVPEETQKFVKDKGIKLIVQKTQGAVKTFNSEKGNKIGMFHLTC